MQLAQLNIGKLRYPVDDPRMSGFTNRLNAINALADRSEGFVWRLVDDNPELDAAVDLRLPGADDAAVNLSVWEGIEPLFQFVYKTAHAKVMRDRLDYFEPATEAYLVLWWVPNGHMPDLLEASERLESLKQNGPSPRAFTFAVPFDEHGTPITTNYPKKDCA